MKIIIASDAYKGSLSSLEVANHIEIGLRRVLNDAEIIKIPIGDGGEGTLDAIESLSNSKRITLNVTLPSQNKGTADYLLLNKKTCFIETAQAAGLHQIGDTYILDRNTQGLGSLIKDALSKGCNHIYLALGGSGTNDYGFGILSTLGVRFLNKDQQVISAIPRNFAQIEAIDTTHLLPEFKQATFTLLCDVENTLYGENGAAHIFAKQKGAESEEIIYLDNQAQRLARLFDSYNLKDTSSIPGSGAAGGIGFALGSFSQVKFQSGIETVLDLVKFDEALMNADLVITGEGKIDNQSIQGKAPVGIAKRAIQHQIPTVAIVGSIGSDYREIYEHHIQSVLACVHRPQSLTQAIKDIRINLENTAEILIRTLLLGQHL